MKGQGGQALVETILVGLVLLVPVVWLLATLSHVHRAALGTTAAAREAGFAVARSTRLADADRAASAAVGQALRDHGLDPSAARVAWSSDLRRGSAVEVRVAYPVPVMAFPLLGSLDRPALSLRAFHVARVDPYRSRP